MARTATTALPARLAMAVSASAELSATILSLVRGFPARRIGETEWRGGGAPSVGDSEATRVVEVCDDTDSSVEVSLSSALG
eukprot:scaffold7529_cov143-Isochrysis_galbana.AAC.3